jgi:hypothetical protein
MTRSGKPNSASCCGCAIQVVALLQAPVTQPVGEIVGLLDTGLLLAYYVKRALDTPDTSDWPGPKAPVAGMALAAFFALNVCLQGLRA